MLFPLPDHRGYAERAVRSWIEQSAPPDSYELVVACDGSEPELEERVERMLRPADRFARVEGAHEIRLYDEAARVARGEILFMTEPHCLAETECLEELVAYLRRTGYDGCCCRSTPLDGNRLSEMEEVLYNEGFREWSRPGHWCKLILRGFAIQREVFVDAGGLETEYDRFSEFALAARLHHLGRRLGYAPGASVQHAYTTSYARLEPPVGDFAKGELAYRETHPTEYCERYFGEAVEWNERRGLQRESARAACRVALSALRRPRNWLGGGFRGLLGAIRQNAGPALLGARSRLARARLAYWAARVRTLIWRRLSRRRLERAYRDGYERMISKARFEYLVDRRLPPARDREPGPRFALAEVWDERLFGFHRVETAEGSAFRWARPVAFADLPVQPGAYSVSIDTGGIRGDAPPVLEVRFNEHRIPGEDVRIDSGRIGFDLDPELFVDGPDQRLTLVSRRLATPRQETRDLALPVAAIEFEPREARYTF